MVLLGNNPQPIYANRTVLVRTSLLVLGLLHNISAGPDNFSREDGRGVGGLFSMQGTYHHMNNDIKICDYSYTPAHT